MSNSETTTGEIQNARVRLRRHVHISEQHYRGDRWYVLSDRMNTTHVRCTPDVRDFLLLLDGNRTVGEALTIVQQSVDLAPTEDEVIKLLAHLLNADMIQGDFNIEADEYYEKRLGFLEKRWVSRLSRPLAIQIPLFDPQRLLDRLMPIGRILFSRPSLIVFIVLVVVAVTIGVTNVGEMTEHFASRFFDPANLFLLWLVYPAIKLLHELGHGLATRLNGGEVRELGIILLVLIPIPYVDASSSTAFKQKSHRMLVAAAGIMVEVFLASIAMIIWAITTPGLVHDLAFDVVLIGGISTVLFNGNPLIKFDGYYVLTDLIEVPGLATRSNRYLGYLIKRYVFRLKSASSPVTAQGESSWLLGYGILSGCYRLFISFSIALFIASRFFVLGVLLALWFLLLQIVLPLGRSLWNLKFSATLENRLMQASFTLCLLLALPLGLLFGVPIGHSTYAQGLIVIPDEAVVRVETPGFVNWSITSKRAAVDAGDLLVSLRNDELVAEKKILVARLDEIRTRYLSLLGHDRIQAGIAFDEMQTITAALKETRAREKVLKLTAMSSGVFWHTGASDLDGLYLERGTVVGHITRGMTATARVAVPQQSVEEVRKGTSNVEVVLASDTGNTIRANVVREVPLVTDRLPSRAFGSSAGGDIAVDMRDSRGITSLSPIFLLDLYLPERDKLYHIGQRVFVRFRHPPQPVGISWLRQAREFITTRLATT